jgi:hypothetical protein
MELVVMYIILFPHQISDAQLHWFISYCCQTKRLRAASHSTMDKVDIG